MKSKVVRIILSMTEAADLQKVLEEFDISPARAAYIVTGREGRRQLKALRRLARIHCRLIAGRYAPFAVQRLAQLLSEKKGETRLKGAVSLLGVAGLDRVKGKGKAGAVEAAKELEMMKLSPEEEREMLTAVAGMMKRRKGRRMGERRGR